MKAARDSLDISGDRVVKLETLISEGKIIVIAHGTSEEARTAFGLLEITGRRKCAFIDRRVERHAALPDNQQRPQPAILT